MTTPQSLGRDLSGRLFQLLRRRSEATQALVHTLCHSCSVEGYDLFVVGGLIRDLLLDEPYLEAMPLDLDLTVDGDPSPLYGVLAEAANAQPRIHDRFGTASVSLADGVHIDLARTRSERYPAPAALPLVTPAPIDVDLQRRDFTINAAGLALTGERANQIIDPHGAVRDLRRRLIRTLHRDSFRDDPTRLIRAVRYASRTGGVIERGTLADARRDRVYLKALSPGRFGDAWRLLLSEPEARTALEIARRLKIPQSRETRWFVPTAALTAFETAEQFWASMGLLGREPDMVDWLPKSVGMNRQERVALESGAQLRELRRSIGGMQRPSSVARALKRFPDSATYVARRIWNGASGAAVSDYLERRSSIHSPISSHRLIELGVERGPALGQWLERIEAAIWDGELDLDDSSSVTRMEQRIRLSR